VRTVRRVVTGALEIETGAQAIGSSLEAAPVVYVSDPDLFAALVDVDLAEVANHLGGDAGASDGPPDAFRLDDVKGVAVEVRLAEGKKCRARGRSCRASAPIRLSRRLPREPNVARWEAMPKRRSNHRGGRPTHERSLRCARPFCGPLTHSRSRWPWRRTIDQAVKSGLV